MRPSPNIASNKLRTRKLGPFPGTESLLIRRNTTTFFPISCHLRSTQSISATSKQSGFKSRVSKGKTKLSVTTRRWLCVYTRGERSHEKESEQEQRANGAAHYGTT